MGWLEEMLSNVAGKGATEVIDKAAKGDSAGNKGRQNGENPFNTLYERLQQRYNIRPKGQEEPQPVQQEQAGYQPIAEEPRQRKDAKAGQADQGRANATAYPEEQEPEKERENVKRPVKALLSALAGGLGSAVANNPLIDVDSAMAEEVGNNTKKDEDEEPKPDVKADKSSKAEAKEITAKQKAVEDELADASKKQADAIKTMEASPKEQKHLSQIISEGKKNPINIPLPVLHGGGSIPSEIPMAMPAESAFYYNPEMAGGMDMDNAYLLGNVDPENARFAPADSSYYLNPDLDDDTVRGFTYGLPSSEDVERTKRFLNGDQTFYPQLGKDPNKESWFTDAYGWLTPIDVDTDAMADWNGYRQTSDGKWYDKNYNLYDEKPDENDPLSGMTDEERESYKKLQDEIQMQEDAQALLLENPDSKGAWAEHNRLMSQGIGSYDREGNVVDGWRAFDYEHGGILNDPQVISAETLEGLTESQLLDLELLNNEKFRQAMADKYGDDWNEIYDAFYADAMNMTGVEDYDAAKREIMNDIFNGTGDFEINPVIKAQLWQRVMNANPDIAHMLNPYANKGLSKEEQEQLDYDTMTALLQAHFEQDPVNLYEWLNTEGDPNGYAAQNTVYLPESAFFGRLGAADPTTRELLMNSGFNEGDMVAAAVLANELYNQSYDNPVSNQMINNVLANAGFNTELQEGVFSDDDKLVNVKSPVVNRPFFPGQSNAKTYGELVQQAKDGFRDTPIGRESKREKEERLNRNFHIGNLEQALAESAATGVPATQLLNAVSDDERDYYLNYLLSDYLAGRQEFEDKKQAKNPNYTKKQFTTKRFEPELVDDEGGSGKAGRG